MHLNLTGAPNARDLGGILSADGRHVRPGMLIRSGALSRLTEEDINKLRQIGLKTVVDFRAERERGDRPDAVIEGVRYVNCPILEQMTGITREQNDGEIAALIAMPYLHGNAADRMAGMYLPLVESDYSTTHYAQFLRCVLEHEDGALLFHCTQGKDRAGIGAMLVLSALGVPRKAILEDYLLTNGYLAAEVDRVVEESRRYSEDPDLEFAIRAFEAASERYMQNAWASIDRNYGSVEAFLDQRLGFGAHEAAVLREKYLT